MRARVRPLKAKEIGLTNSHFAKLEREYEDLDKAIVRLENGVEHASSSELEEKKMHRVTLKDELYALLRA